jgi:hypothetical protein
MGTMHRRRPFSMMTHELDSDEHHVRTHELRQVLRKIRHLTRRLEDALTHQPLALLGVVAGGGFAVGVLTGSRLARALFAASVGFALGRNAPLIARARRRMHRAGP